MKLGQVVKIAGFDVNVERSPSFMGEFPRIVPMAWAMATVEEIDIPAAQRGKLFANLHFFKLSPLTQEALIWHERGHQVLCHLHLNPRQHMLEKIDTLLADFAGKIDPKELAADRYAVDNIGKKQFVRALYEYRDVAEYMIRGTKFELKDMDKRILYWEAT